AASTGAAAAELRALYLMGRWRYDRAEFGAARESFERAYAHAERIGLRWAPYGFDSRFSLVQLAYLTGDWDHGIELADVSGQLPPPIPEAILASGLLAIEAGRGRVDRLSVVPRLRRFWDQDGVIAVSAAPATVELHGVAGDRKAALAEHDDVVETLSRLWRVTFHGRVRLAAVTVGVLAAGLDGESAALRTSVAADAERVWAGGEHTLETLREVGTTWGPEGAAWAARLEAEHLRLRWLAGTDDAPSEHELVAAWRHDLECFTAFGHVIEVARSRTRLAAVLQAAGDVAEARELADVARETATALGAVPLLDELRALGGPRPRVVEREQLTPREREILALVAAGRSNGEIGKQLFIATKTASVHVSNILAKLGASGRTEAAAIARREGLLS
ncbi:MAG: helix-turn-helix transcriptional regulator, partial [Nocardioidaceae bacterium]|nr:helix-turn-helix transcriptional regulator [Nocardioidaceae bacterium]